MRFILALTVVFTVATSGSPAFAAKLSKIGCFGNLAGVNKPQNMSKAQKVNEREIKQVMELVYGLYADEFFSRGLSLQMSYEDDPTFNAFANREEDIARVTIYAGLGMNEYSTTDLVALVTCHELGHHIGGMPRYTGEIMTNEGQADYFAGIECLRRYYEISPFKVPLDVGAVKYCSRVWHDSADIEACARTVGAGQAAAKAFARNNYGIMNFPDLTRRNSERVTETYDGHPEAQCRLDTYAAGAMCENFGESVAQDDVWSGVCSEEHGDRVGVRPRCWYKPMTVAIPR